MLANALDHGFIAESDPEYINIGYLRPVGSVLQCTRFIGFLDIAVLLLGWLKNGCKLLAAELSVGRAGEPFEE